MKTRQTFWQVLAAITVFAFLGFIVVSCSNPTDPEVDNTEANKKAVHEGLYNLLPDDFSTTVGADLFAPIKTKIDEIVSGVRHDTDVNASITTNETIIKGLVKNAEKTLENRAAVRDALSALDDVKSFKAQLTKATGSLIGDFFAPITTAIESIVGTVTHETNVEIAIADNTGAINLLVGKQVGLALGDMMDNARSWAHNIETFFYFLSLPLYEWEEEYEFNKPYSELSGKETAIDAAIAALTLESDVQNEVLNAFRSALSSTAQSSASITPTFSEYMAAQ